jgi:hypothetical protein
MTTKQKTIMLETFERIDPDNHEIPRQLSRVWKVRRVTDSIEFTPGQLLKKNDVDALCASGSWKVTIGEQT